MVTCGPGFEYRNPQRGPLSAENVQSCVGSQAPGHLTSSPRLRHPSPTGSHSNLAFTFPGHLVCHHFASAHEPRTLAGLPHSRFGCSSEVTGRASGGSYRQSVGARCFHFHPQGPLLCLKGAGLEGGRLVKGSFTPLPLEPGGQ